MAKASVARGVGIAGLAGWLLLPAAGIVILSIVASQANISADTQPAWVPLKPATGATSEPVDIALQWRTPPPLLAPEWNGVVQDVHVSAGDTIANGAPVVTISGITRIAIASPAPFYRPISRGVKGADVAWLNDFLAATGRSHGSGSVVASSTVNGIGQLARDLGAEDTRTFDPGWVLFLASSELVVDSVDLVPGSPAPAAGEAVVTSAPSLVRGTSVTRGSLDAFRSDGTQPSGDLPNLSTALVAANAKAVAEGSRIEVAERVLNVEEDRFTLDSESLSTLAGIVSPTMNVLQGNLVRPEKDGDLIAPPAAIVASPAGTSCVVVARENGVSVVPVELVADLDGQVVIRGSLSTADRVQVPPGSAALRCA